MTSTLNELSIPAPRTRPLRVLHVNAGNLYGGIETMLATMASQQPRTPDIAWSFAVCFEGRFADQLRASGAAVHNLGRVRLSRPWTVLAARRRFRRLLAGEPWDAVVTNGNWQHVVAAPVVRRCRLPLVYWAHGIEEGGDLLGRLARRTPPDLVLANSRPSQAAVMAHLFPNVPCELVHYPVASSVPIVAEEERARIRAEFDTPGAAVLGITACRLERWKGHELLLDALGKLRTAADWRWWIVGGAQRRAEQAYLGGLRQQAGRLGLAERIRFLGQRSDVPRLLACADLHCQPNTGPEPFGIAFVEALYAGLPVVTTALGGPLEIVDETCGLLTPPGDADALAQALGRLLDDRELRQRLAAGGPARAASLCDPVRQIERIADVLGRVVGRPDRTSR